jgi:hypothetical protein
MLESLKYFALYVFAQLKFSNILYKVIISKGEKKLLQTAKLVYDNQYVDAHSCMVRKQLFSSSELPTMQFRGLQELFLTFRNYNFIQNVAKFELSKYVQNSPDSII